MKVLQRLRSKRKLLLIIFALIVGASIPTTIILLKNKEGTEVKGEKTSLPAYVRLEVLSDKVTIKGPSDSEYQEGKEGKEIVAGTSIKTDENGRAQVIYPNGSSTRIDKNSEITVQEYSKSPFNVTISLSVGRIWNRVAKLLGGESYQSVSPTAVATVRGTSYGHGILAAGENKITVTKGKVVNVCLNKTQIAEIGESQKGLFDCKSKTPKINIIEPSDQDDWFSLNQEEDLKLNDMFGTEVYADTEDVLGSETDDFDDVTSTPTATLSPTYKLDPNLYLSPNLMLYFTPTPTPTPTSSTILKLDPKVLDSSTYTILTTPTPTPTPTLSPLKLEGSTILLDPQLLITPTPTPTPTPLLLQTFSPIFRLSP